MSVGHIHHSRLAAAGAARRSAHPTRRAAAAAARARSKPAAGNGDTGRRVVGEAGSGWPPTLPGDTQRQSTGAAGPRADRRGPGRNGWDCRRNGTSGPERVERYSIEEARDVAKGQPNDKMIGPGRDDQIRFLLQLWGTQSALDETGRLGQDRT